MQDLDRRNAAAKAKYNTPVAQYDMTSDGTRWRNRITPDQRGIMGVVKDNAAFMEFGMHGVSHEHFRKGVEQRAEYAHIDESKPGRAKTWGWADMNLKASATGICCVSTSRAGSSTCRSPRCRRRTPTTTARPTRTRPVRCSTSTASST